VSWVKKEPIDLRFRQRVCPFEIDRVLCGEHDERARQLEAVALDGDLSLLHRLEQGCLRLGRRPVDLVGEDHVRKHRAGSQREGGVLGRQHVGAGDVRRQQVGGELDAPHGAADGSGEALHERRLRHARHSLEQHVAVRQDRDEHRVQHPPRADVHARDLAAHGLQLFPRGGDFAELGELRHLRQAAASPRRARRSPCMTLSAVRAKPMSS
jgi:hypothetical protein